MDEKYYVPKVEELGIGFEYQYLKSNGAGDFWFDDKITLFSEICGDGNIEEKLSNGEIRVRRLDEEVILGIGFKKMTEEEIKYFGLIYGNFYLTKINAATNGKYIALIIKLYKEYGCDYVDIYLKKEGMIKGYGKAFLIFRGSIKNKSELEKVFNMFNLTKI